MRRAATPCGWYAAPAPAAVHQYLLPAGRSAANLLATFAAVNRWDRQTDRQSDARPFHRRYFAYYAGNVDYRAHTPWQYLAVSSRQPNRVVVARRLNRFRFRRKWIDATVDGRLSSPLSAALRRRLAVCGHVAQPGRG